MKNLEKQIPKTYQELECIFKDGQKCLEFMIEQYDIDILREWFARLEEKPEDIRLVKSTNVKLKRSPYIQAAMGLRDDNVVNDMLRDRLELAEQHVKNLITDLNEPFGNNTTIIIMKKREYYLRLISEQKTLNWRK
jgi:hypothetical protein